MDIVTRLRAEREALVARLAQIDKMLREHDEWGREAQRLLSLTPAPQVRAAEAAIEPHGSTPSEAPPALDSEVPQRSGGIRKRTFPVQAGDKTPMPAFEAAVIDVLREAKQPMDRTELYEALTARGIVIGSGTRDKDLNALSARVYRMAQNPENRITGERGQGYRLMGDGELDASVSTGQPEASAPGDDDLI